MLDVEVEVQNGSRAVANVMKNDNLLRCTNGILTIVEQLHL